MICTHSLARPAAFLVRCHNCTSDEQEAAPKSVLTGSKNKTDFAIRANCESLVNQYGENLCGFLTLTMSDATTSHFAQVYDAAEASRRFHSLLTHVLRGLFAAGFVTERHKSGAIHFHLLVALAERDDIHTGYNYYENRNGNHASASPPLRKLWKFLRQTLPKYGFGAAPV